MRCWGWTRKRRAEDWAEELRAHIALEADERREAGINTVEAKRAARRVFGNMTGVQERLYEQGRWAFWDHINRDLRLALRLMVGSPGFSALVVVTLALGIGANVAIFSLVNAVLLRPLPYKNSERLAMLWSEDTVHNVREQRVSLLNFADWRRQSHSFEDMTIFVGQTFLLGTDGSPERLREARVPANFFPLLGIEPAAGRIFTSDEENHGERVVVLTNALAQRLFGSTGGAVGKDLRMDGRLSRIVGVMPDHFQFPFADTQVWEPLTAHPYWARNKGQPRSAADWYVLGRLRRGITWTRAQAEMEKLSKQLANEHPENRSAPDVSVVPLNFQNSGPYRLSLGVLLGAVFVILLIACLNVANLLLVRGSSRQREFDLRRALGASRARLVTQLFTEILLLGSAGAAIGLLIAWAGLKAMIAFGPSDIPRWTEAQIDGPVLLFACAMAIVCTFISGLWPATQSGTSAAGARSWMTRANRNVRNLLVVGEFSLALVLLVGAGLFVHSLLRLQAVDPGFRPEHLLVMRIDLHVGRTAPQQAAYFEQAIETVRAIPGVRSAAGVGRFLNEYRPQPVAIEGRPAEPSAQSFEASDAFISGPYFETVGVPLKMGRRFSNLDGPNEQLVAIINQAMAHAYWPNESALGKRFSFPDPDKKTTPWIKVVGVVGDTHRQGLERRVGPQVFRPENQDPDNEMDLLVRTASDANGLAAVIREQVQAQDKTVAQFKVASVQELLGGQEAERKFNTSLIGLFSLLAMFLSALGIYGLMHHSVAQRRQEIGVRIALGASYRMIVTMILQQGMALSCAGIFVGLLGALALTKLLSRLLYGVTSTDPLTFLTAPAILLALAAVACWIPARRAARRDPSSVLRQE